MTEDDSSITVHVATVTLADRHRLSQIIAAAGYRVLATSTSLEEAVKIQRTVRPILTVIDASLSSTPGVDVIRALREADPNCKVIVSLAPMQLHFQTPAIVAGADELVYRPYTAAKVIRAIQNALLPRAA